MVRQRDAGGTWSAPIPIEEGNQDHYSPVIAARPDGGAMAAWSGRVSGNFELHGSQISNEGKLQRPVRLSFASLETPLAA